MKLDAMLFDLDGTLMHTSLDYPCTIVNWALRDLGRPPMPMEDAARFWFFAEREQMIRDEFRVDSDLFWERYNFHETPELRRNHLRPYPDAGFVRYVKALGLKTGIVTTARPDVIDLEMEFLGREYFDEIVSARNSNGMRSKPAPDGVFRCLSLLGTAPENAIFVGNSNEDVLAAKAAGVLPVVVDRKECDFGFPDGTIVVPSLYHIRRLDVFRGASATALPRE